MEIVMSVIRKHHNKNYTVMSNYHFLDKTLSLKAKGLLSLMLSLPDDWDYSTKGLETLSRDGNTSVRSALNELEEHEYLIRERIYEDGKIVDWTYHIFESRDDCDRYKNDKLHAEGLHVENQHVENNNNKILTQSNTKKENKNNSKELLQNSPSFEFGRKPKVRESLFTKCVTLIDDFVDTHNCDNSVRRKLISYLNYRLQINDKPLYVNMWKGMLTKLYGLYQEGHSYESVIDFCIERGYLSFYPPTTYSVKSKPWEKNVHSDSYTDDELEELAEIEKEREAKGMRTKF